MKASGHLYIMVERNGRNNQVSRNVVKMSDLSGLLILNVSQKDNYQTVRHLLGLAKHKWCSVVPATRGLHIVCWR